MQVPKALLEQFVFCSKEHHFEQLKALYVNESEGYIFFFATGYQCFFIAFNGNTLPKRIEEKLVKQITCDELEASLSECGDMVDLSNFKAKEACLGRVISGLNLFLKMNKNAASSGCVLYHHKWLKKAVTFLTSILTVSEMNEAYLNISYLNDGNYAFRAKTNELDFYCVACPEED